MTAHQKMAMRGGWHQTVAVGVVMCVLACAAGVPPTAVQVFTHGEGGYPCIRTPALVRAPHPAGTTNGSANNEPGASQGWQLLAFAGTRCGPGDGCYPKKPTATLNHSDAVMKTSRDGGRTWSALRVLNRATCDERNHGAAVTDHVRGTVLFVFNDAELMWIRSKDGGASWTAPAAVGLGGNATTANLSPGAGLQLSSAHPTAPGRLLFTAYRLGQGVVVFFSDDGGDSWTASRTVIPNGNEATAVELANGTLLLNARDDAAGSAGGRRVAVSVDGGVTWSTRPTLMHQFGGANCMGSMIAPTASGPIYFSHPFRTTSARANGTVFVSADGGAHFVPWVNVGTGPDTTRSDQPFAYSCLSPTDDAGGVGLLYETGDAGCSATSASCKILFTQLATRNTAATAARWISSA